MNEHSKSIFALSSKIRYVALYRNSQLEIHQRDGLSGASDAESDRYEELLVNPTVLKLASQRGDIDCGGASFVIIGYGNFYQLIVALPDGHASVAFEKTMRTQSSMLIAYLMLVQPVKPLLHRPLFTAKNHTPDCNLSPVFAGSIHWV